MNEKGIDLETVGLPTYEKYLELRNQVTDYTDGYLMITSWRWDQEVVAPGDSAGLCIFESESKSDSYWSCWEYKMNSRGDYAFSP